MTIRTAAASDAEALSELVGSLAHFYLQEPVDPEGSQRPLPEWFANTITVTAFEVRISDPDYLNLVNEQAGKIVGYISVKQRSHLYHLFVAEYAHGQGIARLLWNSVLGRQPLVSQYSLRSSLFAVPVYQKLGFQINGEAGMKDGIGFQPMVFGR